jgi:hypothetical protein
MRRFDWIYIIFNTTLKISQRTKEPNKEEKKMKKAERLAKRNRETEKYLFRKPKNTLFVHGKRSG